MLSKLICGTILVSAAAGASAQTWNFGYTGFRFVGPYEDQFLPDARISGSFSGTDRNGDGDLSAAELTSFIVHSSNIDGADFTRCAQNSSFVFSCSLDAFSFGPKGSLAFTVNWQGNSNEITRTGRIVSGVDETLDVSTGGVFLYTDKWLWTKDTKLLISPPPVPEPPPAPMALAGLLALAGVTSKGSRFDRQRRPTC